jgi:hypothetical protein
MLAEKLLHGITKKSCPDMHSHRRTSFFAGVSSLLRFKRLTVSGLGQGIKNKTKVKHNINRMNRLVGNEKLYEERIDLYSCLAQELIKGLETVVILVDWSAVTPGGREQLIRASVAVKGRGITIYEAVYTDKTYNSPKAHKEFLDGLKQVLPEGCVPIIVSDAGFRVPWFKLVKSYGWNFVGRVRTPSHCQIGDETEWTACTDFFPKANGKACYLGEGLLTIKSKFRCGFYLIKKPKKGRVKMNLWKKRSKRTNSLRSERTERDPWLIVTSLQGGQEIADKVIAIYASRMQIEEAFRDLKNDKWGFGLSHTRTKDTKRLEILVLIAAFANLVCWLLGVAAKNKKAHYQFQANTVKTRDVLSVINLGLKIIFQENLRFTKGELIFSIGTIRNLIAAVVSS